MARWFYALNTLLVLVSCWVVVDLLDVSSYIAAMLTSALLLGTSLVLFYRLPSADIHQYLIKLNLVMIGILSLSSLPLVLQIIQNKQHWQLVQLIPFILCLCGLYFSYAFLGVLHQVKQQTVEPYELINRIFSGSSVILALFLAIPATVFLLMVMINAEAGWLSILAVKFSERGIIPPLTLLIFIWSLIMFAHKFCTLIIEKNTFIKTPSESALLRAFALLKSQSPGYASTNDQVAIFTDLIWKTSIDFYTLPRFISWAIPVLGFIGTVLGISLASQGILEMLSESQQTENMIQHLGLAISPLGIAFDTTLIALSLSVGLVLLQTALQHYEQNLLLAIEREVRQYA
jgi:hypothetical protein